MSLKQFISDLTLDFYLRRKMFSSGQDTTAAKGVGIVFSAESLQHQQQAIRFNETVKSMTQESTYLFGYVHRKLDSHVTFGFPHFSLSDVTIKPDFSRHKLDFFMGRKYRVLVNLDLNNFKILHYVIDKTPAVSKMAISPIYPALYNIIVEKDISVELPQLIDKTLDIFEKTVGS